jgi:nucleoside-diphosphate-sugar epimerase
MSLGIDLKYCKKEIPYPAMAGSWYHMTRAFDAANLWLANKQFKLSISELRTSIVTGSSTELTRNKPFNKNNRFDVDFYFGVVTNRFVAQALSTRKLTVYGKGLQGKPMVSLDDMVLSTVRCIENKIDGKYVVYNQVEKPMVIVNLAKEIRDSFADRFNFDIEIEHVPNPRVEDEEHEMTIANGRFITDLCNDRVSCTIENAINQMCQDLFPYKDKIKEVYKRGK